MFHSSELMPRASPYVRDAAGLERFLERLRAIIGTALQTKGVEWATLREIGTELMSETVHAGDR